MSEKFYEQFFKHTSEGKTESSSSKRRDFRPETERTEFYPAERAQERTWRDEREDFSAQKSFAKPKLDRKRTHAHRHESAERKKFASLRRELFAESAIPAESREIIEHFDDIVASVRNLSGKQKVALYGKIKSLSHQLTDDRGSRRLGYMNEAASISAYISYFMWWNLVRMTRLFANLPKSAFESLAQSEKPVALDVGSGTLTVVIALWLARPELRAKKITWYCLDLSQTALSAGEDLYYAIVAKTIKGAVAPSLQPASQSSATPTPKGHGSGIAFTETRSKPVSQVLSANAVAPYPLKPPATEPWNIIRVKGSLGTSIKEKADFISCANVFNEILQRNEQPTDFLAKKYTLDLLSYLKSENSAVLLVEPGDPHSARFISLMRDALIRRDFLPIAPCPHTAECPMAGRTNGRTTNAQGKNAKWCNFAFDTENAPSRLLKLSEKAGLAKERASLSFVISKKSVNSAKSVVEPVETTSTNAKSGHLLLPAAMHKLNNRDSSFSEKTFIRIASDFIRLPELHKSGYYACSEFGLLLAIDERHIQPKNGELLQIKTPEDLSEIDKKSGGIIVKL